MAKLIVVSNIKKVAKNINIAGDVPAALNKKIEQIIKEAVARAKANNRKTLQGRDI
jgi:histone H3/H4